MIAVDTSALIAVILGENDAEMFAGALADRVGEIGVSAATLVETRIVAEAKQGADATADLRCDHVLLPCPREVLEGGTDELLGFAVGIHVGRVDHVDAAV